MSLQEQQKPKRIIKMPEVSNKTALCKTAIYELIAKGKFPKQVRLSTRSVGWSEASVDQWIDERIALSDAGAVA